MGKESWLPYGNWCPLRGGFPEVEKFRMTALRLDEIIKAFFLKPCSRGWWATGQKPGWFLSSRRGWTRPAFAQPLLALCSFLSNGDELSCWSKTILSLPSNLCECGQWVLFCPQGRKRHMQSGSDPAQVASSPLDWEAWMDWLVFMVDCPSPGDGQCPPFPGASELSPSSLVVHTKNLLLSKVGRRRLVSGADIGPHLSPSAVCSFPLL